MADDVESGLMCTQCGIYFTQPHGHAALCEDCWEEVDDEVIALDEDGKEYIKGTKTKRAIHGTI